MEPSNILLAVLDDFLLVRAAPVFSEKDLAIKLRAEPR
jgi:hypothetical protein